MLLPFFNQAKQPDWDNVLDLDKIESQLRTEPIVALKPMKKYLAEQKKVARYKNIVYVATLKNGLKAVFKPERQPFLAYGEVAAYRASKWLNTRLVPPTVMKTFRGKKGSLQFFVESPFDLFNPTDLRHAEKLLSAKNRSDMTLFYYVFWGRLTFNPLGNKLISRDKDGKGYLALIDNAAFMQKKPDLRPKKVPLPSVYSKATLDRYYQLDIQALRWIFEDALKYASDCCSNSFFQEILNRKNRMIAKQRKTIID